MTNSEHVVPVRRVKERKPTDYRLTRPGSSEAIRHGCRCSTITGLPSLHCPWHWELARAAHTQEAS